jgi:hypothetical protein
MEEFKSMGFETVVAADVKLEKPQPVPLGHYVFQLQPGASYRINPFNQIQELNVRFDVTEGDFAGRPVFVSYPDPTAVTKGGKSLAWSNQALKKLEISLGTDALPGEGWADYLNRVAMNAHSRISADIIAGKPYQGKDGNPVPGDPQFGIFTVAAAA